MKFLRKSILEIFQKSMATSILSPISSRREINAICDDIEQKKTTGPYQKLCFHPPICMKFLGYRIKTHWI